MRPREPEPASPHHWVPHRGSQSDRAGGVNDDDFLESATEAASVLDAISLRHYDIDVGAAASDARDFMVGTAVHYHVALQLGLDPAVLFDEAAAWAGPAGDLLQAFGRRQDMTLEAFGWREVATEHGPGFVPA